MKVEVISRSTQETIKIYPVPDLSVFDFQEWKELSEIVTHLDCLLDTVENLDSKDSVTQEPVSRSPEVDFYLPDPLKDRALCQFAKSQIASEEPPEQFDDRLNEITERVSAPVLKSSTILVAVVTEILQNHHPHSDYKVRISDG